MITALAARWLLTVAFAAAVARPGASCVVMCVALTAMTWWSEPAAVAWVQAAVFVCAALWSELAGADVLACPPFSMGFTRTRASDPARSA